MAFKNQTFKDLLGEGSDRRSPLLPAQRPCSPVQRRGFLKSGASLSCRPTTFLLIAITSAFILINTAQIQYLLSSSSGNHVLSHAPQSEHRPTTGTGLYDHEYNDRLHIEEERQPEHSTEDTNPIDNKSDQDSDRNDTWSFPDESPDQDMKEESQQDGSSDSSKDRQCCSSDHKSFKPIEEVVSPECPRLFLTTETSFDRPSYTSSSTVPVESSTPSFTSPSFASATLLRPDDVKCWPIPSQLKEYSLAFCVSVLDCSQGFIQVVHEIPASDPVFRTKISKESRHNQHFQRVAGPDDFYFRLEGAQRLALGARLVPSNLMVRLDDTSSQVNVSMTPDGSSLPVRKLVYRADFRMVLPGPVQLTGWLTYKEFKAVRESKPGVWPEWSHTLLINPKTEIDPSDKARGATTNFTICPACEMDTFLDQLKEYRETHFEQCDRMAPARGSYWREDLALRIYSELDTINRAPGAGANYRNKNKKGEQMAPSLTRGWRFVPNGCTMTKTSGLPNASSQDPYLPTCDSIASPGIKLAPPRQHSDNGTESNHNNTYPRRRILFIGDSQVRTTYNAILNHYRGPVDMKYQRFAFHDEFIPSLEELGEESTPATEHESRVVVPGAESDTAIELIYKADQFLRFLVRSKDDELDQYDTIYFNLGQWPASGPGAGGQWSTDRFLKQWEAVMERLNRWKRSRDEKLRSQSLHSAKGRTTAGSGESSVVIWAGMNAFPMRTDPHIKTKGDWRTNARLGYWDDWIETISQRAGGWIRRLNAWQLTFPLLDQVIDKAHFQLTDAIDALKIEALYKLDLCSRMRADIPNQDIPTTST